PRSKPTRRCRPPAASLPRPRRSSSVSDSLGLALLILVLPLAAAVLAALFNTPKLRPFAHVPLIVTCGTAAVLALVLLAQMAEGNYAQVTSDPSKASWWQRPLTWFAAGKLSVRFTITVDPLA